MQLISLQGSKIIPSLQVLDGVTLSNLDVTENSSTGTLEGTLLQRIDQCSTPFGRFENQFTKVVELVQIFLDCLIAYKKHVTHSTSPFSYD